MEYAENSLNLQQLQPELISDRMDALPDTAAFLQALEPLEDLIAAIESESQAIILYGPRSVGKSALLTSFSGHVESTENCLPVLLNIRASLERSRLEVLYELAVRMVEGAGLSHGLLDDFSPNQFHKAFIEAFLLSLPLGQSVLFIFDDIDLSDRGQLSKLNNLVLPLLRRLAPLERVRFILAVDCEDPEKIRTLVQPIFTSLEEVKVVGESVVGESVFGGPVVGESVVGESVVGESVVGESVVGESVVGESVVGESGLNESEIQQPAPVEQDHSQHKRRNPVPLLRQRRLHRPPPNIPSQQMPSGVTGQMDADANQSSNWPMDHLGQNDFVDNAYEDDAYEGEAYENNAPENEALLARVLLLVLLLAVIIFMGFNIGRLLLLLA